MADTVHTAMRAPRKLKCGKDDRRRLITAIRTPPKHLSSKKRKRLRILRQLCDSVPGAKIAKLEDVTPAAVSKMLKEAVEQTVGGVIDRLLRPSKLALHQTSKRPRAGRPGRDQVLQLLDIADPKYEAVYELSTLILAENLKVAVISYSDRSFSVAPTENTETVSDNKLRRAKKAHEDIIGLDIPTVHWTRTSMQDTRLAEIFRRLREGELQLPWCKQQKTRLEPLSNRFGKNYRHSILWSGSKSVFHAVRKVLCRDLETRDVLANRDAGFLNHLESVLFNRRMKKSCVGFMPTLDRFWQQVRSWSIGQSRDMFQWQTGEDEITGQVALSSISQDYLAAFGIQSELRPFLWSRVAYEPAIPFRTLPVNTKFEFVEQVDSNHVRLEISPLPNIAYKTVVAWSGKPDELLRGCREMNANRRTIKRFVYSADPLNSGGARESVVLPRNFPITSEQENQLGSVGVVLFPRHFLSPAPPVTPGDFTRVVEYGFQKGRVFEMPKGQCPSPAGLESDLLVFHLPELASGIRRRIADGHYRAHIDKLADWQTKLSELGMDDEIQRQDANLSTAFMRIRPEAAWGPDLWDWLGMSGDEPHDIDSLKVRLHKITPTLEAELERDPFIKLEAEELALKTLPEKIMQSFRKQYAEDPQVDADKTKSSARDLPTAGELTGGIQDLNATLFAGDNLANLARNICAIEQNYKRRQSELKRELDEEVMRIFPILLKEVDADFLLRHLDAATANELAQGEEEWKRNCENIIRTQYWPLQHNKEKGRDLEEFAFYLVKNLVKEDLRETYDSYRHEVESYCLDALNQFANARSAVRSAVENLQRCVLDDVAPVAIHMETHNSLMKRWSSNLKQGLNGHLLDIVEKNKEKLGKTKKNAQEESKPSRAAKPTSYDDALKEYAKTITSRESDEDLPRKSPIESPEVNKIISVFEQLLVSADSNSLLKAFIETTHTFDKNDWMKAFKGLAEFQLTGEEFRRFTNAYQFCLEEIPVLGSEKSIPKKLPKLRRIFSGDLITLDMEGKKVSKAASRRAK